MPSSDGGDGTSATGAGVSADAADMPVTREVVIASASGLHARPASVFSAAASACAVPVTVGFPGGRQVNAASVLMVMTLGLHRGDIAVLSAHGPGAHDAVSSLATLLEQDLDDLDTVGGA